jgi:serine/threonine-protein kinase RsbT
MKESSEPVNTEHEAKSKVFAIRSDKDLVEIRAYGRKLAGEVGFNVNEQTLIATALSEVCRNIIEYAGVGKVIIEAAKGNPSGIVITAKDKGPGIEDVERALEEGYSTGRGMGIGLPGSKRIMDEFHIDSKVGEGTIVRMHKWVHHNEY